MKSLTSGIELRQPDTKYDLNKELPIDALHKKILSNTDMLPHIEDLFRKWLETIEKSLDTDINVNAGPDAGPRTELDFWRSKMQSLTSVIEQLKRKDIDNVIRIINICSKPTGENNYALTNIKINRETLAHLTLEFKKIEARLTESMNEAKDNVKYLSTLEKFLDPLYQGTPQLMIDTLPALMNSVKMIHTIAR